MIRYRRIKKIPNAAMRVRNLTIRPRPPKNSAAIARNAKSAGMCMIPVKKFTDNPHRLRSNPYEETAAGGFVCPWRCDTLALDAAALSLRTCSFAFAWRSTASVLSLSFSSWTGCRRWPQHQGTSSTEADDEYTDEYMFKFLGKFTG